MNSETIARTGQFDLFAPKGILVASDFSAPATAALVAGLHLAHRTGAPLIVLNVMEETLSLPWGTPVYEYLAERDARHRKTIARLQRLIAAHFLARYPGAEVPAVKVIAVEGDPATEIVKVAFDHQADLILLASHGQGRLKRLLLGSTAEKVVRHASCTVLVIRDSKESLDLPPVRPMKPATYRLAIPNSVGT